MGSVGEGVGVESLELPPLVFDETAADHQAQQEHDDKQNKHTGPKDHFGKHEPTYKQRIETCMTCTGFDVQSHIPTTFCVEHLV